MEYSKYCSVCLITGVKMNDPYSVDYELLQFLRFPLISSTELKTKFCFECAALLRKFEKFRRKCDKAQEVLSQLRQHNYKITLKNIQSVDRTKHKLASGLSLNTVSYLAIGNIQIDIKDENVTCEIKPNKENFISETHNEIKIENGLESPRRDYDVSVEDYDLNDSITENTHTYIHKIHKITSKKQHKSVKRKHEDILESISDDEPLANKVSKSMIESKDNRSKINEEPKEVEVKKNRKNCNLKSFEEYATITFLSPEEATKELLLRKESSNYVNSPFKCKFCYRGFEGESTFENHMKKHGNENGEYECEICHLRFSEPRCLYKHRLASHKRKYSCKLCSYVCFDTSQAKTHISLHKGKKYPCEECGQIFSMPNSLLMHKRLKHVTECVCDLCGNTFAKPRGLYSHQMKIHRLDKNEKLGPKCAECGIQFATEEAWKLHLVLSSKHNVSNGCKCCGESFPSAEELKTHMRTHGRRRARRSTQAPPTACTICDEQLPDPGGYRAHMTAAHPSSDITRRLAADERAPFVCETCGLAFKKQCFLKYHQRKHTGERPYKCAECDKSFQLTGSLSSHRAVHARRTHACRTCGRGFTYKSALNKHMKIHLNIRPHRCDICDKSFMHPCDVRVHIKYVHNKVPWPKRDRITKTTNITNPPAHRDWDNKTQHI